MSEGKHHHLFHHHKEEDNPQVEAVRYSETTAYGTDGSSGGYAVSSETVVVTDYEKERKHHKRLEEVGGLGAVAAGAFALHEKHEAKKDPENAHKHKIEEEIAAAALVGSGGFAFHEKHEKKEAKREEETAEGKHHHRLFLIYNHLTNHLFLCVLCLL